MMEMNDCAELIEGEPGTGLFLIADHASNHVPDGMTLGIPEDLLREHIAIDIGVEPLSRELARRLRCPAVLARYSRLVVDLNRDAEDRSVIPEISDGHVIPANQSLSSEQRRERIDRFWVPYHRLIESKLEELRPLMLFTVHSFTPQLASRPHEERPWEVGILHNRDERAARLAIDLLRGSGIVTGDNQPYSGRELNATMDRHAEGRGLPYLGIEVRQDLIATPDGVKRWADRLCPVIQTVGRSLAC
jgi:predicted N-formylglutamate amidohydrolase